VALLVRYSHHWITAAVSNTAFRQSQEDESE